MKKMNAKIHPTTFLAVNVLYVASAREFYIVEVGISNILFKKKITNAFDMKFFARYAIWKV